jgi:hypothetical protein
MQEMPEPRPTYVLARGAYDAPGELVQPRRRPASCRSTRISRGTGWGWPGG